MTRAQDARQWHELVEEVRREHNGVFVIDLFFGHDGHNVCRFKDYDKTIAEGESGRSMQEAVRRCYGAWKLELEARTFVRDLG
jgi:hypothetical protein